MPPRIVMIVDNAVDVDSRVQKSARAAADAGYDVVVVGRAEGLERVEKRLVGVPVVLVPAPRWLTRTAIDDPGFVPTRPRAYRSEREGLDAGRRLQAAKADTAADVAALRDRIDAAKTAGGPKPVRAWRVRRLWRQVARRQHEQARREQRHERRLAGWRANAADVRDNTGWPGASRRWRLRLSPSRGWRDVDLELADVELGFGSEVDRLEPDLIHAHDFRMIAVAVRSAARARLRDRTVRVLYDVHEWLPGVPHRDPVWRRANEAMESEFLPRADAVVTVSDELARMLQERYRLTAAPTVVLNAPEPPDDDTRRRAPSLRERCGVGPDTPLLVYSGAVSPARGLATVVAALPDLPGVHLALVVGRRTNPYVVELVEQAADLGVSNRLHVTRYVAPDVVVPFLAGADVGLIPLHHAPNHEISLITKYLEYVAADLPIVVSDVRTMAAFTREHGNGELFPAEDTAAFAAAVRRVLADPARYRAAYTPDLRASLSWPGQAEVLAGVWHDLVGPGEPAAASVDDGVTTLAGPPVLPPADPAAPVRLVVGPTNMAGQGAAWAGAAARDLPGVQATVVTMRRAGSVLEFRCDVRVGAERLDPAWVDRALAEVEATRSHVLLESGLTLFGSSGRPADVEREVATLEAAGVRVGIALHGSEVRSPRDHLARYPWSAFATADPDWVEALQRRTDDVAPLVDWLGLPTFVSTPDLLDDVPRATWLPVTVDVERYAAAGAARPALRRFVPVVLHAPSRAATKGSAAIDPVLTALEAEGLVVYRRLRGVPPEQMADHLADADVVVDQVGLGLYGVLACEAMAAGRVVVGQVGDAVRSRIPARVPVVEAGADDLDAVLRELLADRDAARVVAAAGPGFVRRFHDGRAAAAALAPFLGLTPHLNEETA